MRHAPCGPPATGSACGPTRARFVYLEDCLQLSTGVPTGRLRYRRKVLRTPPPFEPSRFEPAPHPGLLVRGTLSPQTVEAVFKFSLRGTLSQGGRFHRGGTLSQGGRSHTSGPLYSILVGGTLSQGGRSHTSGPLLLNSSSWYTFTSGTLSHDWYTFT